MIFNRVHGTLQPASSAVPAFDRVENERLLLSIWPGKDIARTDLVAVATLDAFLVNHRGHGRSPYEEISMKGDRGEA